MTWCFKQHKNKSLCNFNQTLGNVKDLHKKYKEEILCYKLELFRFNNKISQTKTNIECL